VYKKASLVEKIDFNVLFALQVVFLKQGLLAVEHSDYGK
jgi:hypothetical protein